jgi:hypothetical protein
VTIVLAAAVRAGRPGPVYWSSAVHPGPGKPCRTRNLAGKFYRRLAVTVSLSQSRHFTPRPGPGPVRLASRRRWPWALGSVICEPAILYFKIGQHISACVSSFASVYSSIMIENDGDQLLASASSLSNELISLISSLHQPEIMLAPTDLDKGNLTELFWISLY